MDSSFTLRISDKLFREEYEKWRYRDLMIISFTAWLIRTIGVVVGIATANINSLVSP